MQTNHLEIVPKSEGWDDWQGETQQTLEGVMESETRNLREASQLMTTEIINYVVNQKSTGEWPVGYRMPTEKTFIKQFGAARNTVRKAMSLLENDGVILRQVGRGTFIRGEGHGDESVDDLSTMIRVDSSPAAINEFRLILEPATAELVVARATQSDIKYAQECFDNTLNAKSTEEYERWEAELHVAIICAARNNVLTGIYRSIDKARQQPEWKEIKRRSLNDSRRERYERDHAAMVDAFTRRDAVALRHALKTHLEAVSHNMLNPSD